MNRRALASLPASVKLVAMLRAIVVLPSFSRGDEIESFRARHDPLARSIPAHVTLVFPFETNPDAATLAKHAAAAAEDQPAFPLTLGKA